MPTTNPFNGDSLVVEVDGKKIAFSQSHTFSLSADLPDTTSKDSDRFEEHIRGNRNWSISASGLVDFAKTFGVTGMIDEIISGTSVVLRFTTDVSGDDILTGTANVESVEIDSPQGAPVTMSVTFKGTGAIVRTVAA